MENNNFNPCKNCKSESLHCYNTASPCCGYYCGEYPGTGKSYSNNKEDKDKRKK